MRLFGKAKQGDERKYGLKYLFKPEYGEFAKSDAEKKYTGLADAVVFISLVNTDTGFSQAMYTYDSRNEKRELTDEQLFGVWLTLCYTLAQRVGLAQHLRAFSAVTLKSFREYMQKFNARDDKQSVNWERMTSEEESKSQPEHDHVILDEAVDESCTSPMTPS